MDKNAIKRYAIWARGEMVSRVAARAAMYGVTEKGCADADADSVNGRLLSSVEKSQRKAFIEKAARDGYEETVEEVAYTWFNRFCALRYMEVNGYLPSRVRVFTNDAGEFRPQILDEALRLDMEGLDRDKVLSLKSDANGEEALFRYLLIAQCNALSAVLPGMFQRIEDYTELLLPDNLLREGSVIGRMIADIPAEDWTDQVQIIGWLYQYYNAEKKDEVFAALKNNVKVAKEDIPAATQLFTPDWIVRYMVENSLGRLWVEGHPDDGLKSNWKYYLEEAEQEPEVEEQLKVIRKEYSALKPEDILCIDPCAGSGHILCYLFDVLMQIYESYGYAAEAAAESIVENNLYGLDIDERAAQLAYFAVMMKARSYDRDFFSRGIQPRVYAVCESNGLDMDVVDYFVDNDASLRKDFASLTEELYDAKEYGSIIDVMPVDFAAMYARIKDIENDPGMMDPAKVTDAVLPLIQVGETLSRKYDVVVTNPPYMGSANMNGKLSDFIKRNYADYKSDFFSAIIVRCKGMAKNSGYLGFFTPYVWMFIQSYEKLRGLLYSEATIETLIQFEYSAFEEATVPVCTFAFKNGCIPGKRGCYLRLTDFRGGMEVQRQRALEAISDHDCGFYFEQCTDSFSKIPGSPVAYWVSTKFVDSFKLPKLGDIIYPKTGFTTGNNDRFLRLWFEIDSGLIGKRWFYLNKGGAYRKWYGNNEYVVDWENDGERIRKNPGSTIRNSEFYFMEGVTWSKITTYKLSGRYSPNTHIFDAVGLTCFTNKGIDIYYILALMCSCVASNFMDVLNPTMSMTSGAVGNLPFYYSEEAAFKIHPYSYNNTEISRTDWDSFETSWDFVRHPLVRPVKRIADAYGEWEKECDDRFNQLKANEEELNRIFIDIYGLQNELTPEEEDKDVTVRKADLKRDVRSFISYAVGCMFGRYSLDVDGLAYAGGEWDDTKFVTYRPDRNGILPICDDEYFQDDIVGHFVDFVKAVYGEDTLEENLRFIADALGGTGTARDAIRRYFLNDFFEDHCRVYQKRPIYWLFDSGKKNGFKCLVYLHRYQKDTVARIRTDYVQEQQARYHTAESDLENRMKGASGRERVKIEKSLEKIHGQAEETRLYEERVHHVADQFIDLDLDDGVKVNYGKLQDILAKIK